MQFYHFQLSMFFKWSQLIFLYEQGGLKAIVWVDAIQSLIMITGGITLFILSLSRVGGFNKTVENLDDAGLNNFFEFVFFFYI